jgi:hypothetical protein
VDVRAPSEGRVAPRGRVTRRRPIQKVEASMRFTRSRMRIQ